MYGNNTPSYAIDEFIKQYTKVLDIKKALEKEKRKLNEEIRGNEYDRIMDKMKENLNGNNIQDRINVIVSNQYLWANNYYEYFL